MSEEHFILVKVSLRHIIMASSGPTRTSSCFPGGLLHLMIISIIKAHIIMLSRADEVGSPTNHLGSRQRQDTGQVSSSPLTGGLNLVINYQKLKNTDRLLDPFYWGRVSLARHNIKAIRFLDFKSNLFSLKVKPYSYTWSKSPMNWSPELAGLSHWEKSSNQ